jgi:prevent-host-death family protein
MKHFGIKETREQLSDLIDRVEAGEEIVITRQGRPVARLVPAPGQRKSLPPLAEFRKRMGSLGTPSNRLLREERDEWADR